MTATAIVARVLAAVVGVGILALMVDASITATGGYGTSTARLAIGLAAGLVAGSVAVGVAWEEGRRGIAWCLIVALVAGEAWALLQTAERTIAHRDQQQAPLHAAAETRAKAAERVRATEAALAGIGDTPRLIKAQAAKAAADAAVVAKAAEKGCVTNCAKLLQGQVEAAATEVAAARAEITSKRAAAEGRLEQARAELAALPLPPSATPLADRLGIRGWSLDLFQAWLASLAANGLAGLLLAFAAHGRRHRPAVVAVPPVPVAEVITSDVAADNAEGTTLVDVTPPTARDAKDEADRFARAALRPKKSGRVKLAEIRVGYHAWCRKRGLEPLPDLEIGPALAGLFSSVGLYRRGKGASAAIVGIEWSGREPLQIEGP
jgi:hypothetical protein